MMRSGSAIPPRIDPRDERAASAVLGAIRRVMDDFDDPKTRDGAAVRLVTSSINYALAWRALHGADAALPHNPGFAHCARRYMAMGEYGAALALVHRAQADGWEDPKFEALEKECLSYLPKVR